MFQSQDRKSPLSSLPAIAERYPWLNQLSTLYPNEGEYRNSAKDLSYFIGSIALPAIQEIKQLEALKKKTIALSKNEKVSKYHCHGIPALLRDEFEALSRIKAVLQKITAIEKCLHSGENPQLLLSKQPKSLIAVAQWRWSQTYRDKWHFEAKEQIRNFNDQLTDHVEKLCHRLLVKLCEDLVVLGKQDRDLPSIDQLSSMKNNWQKTLGMPPQLIHCVEFLLELSPEVGMRSISRFADVAGYNIEKLATDQLRSAGQIVNRVKKELRSEIDKRYLALTTPLFHRARVHSTSVSGDELPRVLESIPTEKDLESIFSLLHSIKTNNNLVSCLSSESRLDDEITRLEEYVVRGLDEYWQSCRRLSAGIVTHTTGDKLAMMILSSGYILSSRAQYQNGNRAFVSSKLGAAELLPDVSFSLSGIELQYGGQTEFSTNNGGITIAERTNTSIESLDSSSIVFVLPFSSAVRTQQFVISTNTQRCLSGNYHELHIYDDSFSCDKGGIGNHMSLGARVSIEDAKILIPNSMAEMMLDFMLRQKNEGGCGRCREWIDSHVVCYPDDEGVKHFFQSYQNSLFPQQKIGLSALSGKAALEAGRSYEKLLHWHEITD